MNNPSRYIHDGTSPYDVFLCYSSADRLLVQQVKDSLREGGIRTWFDVDELPPGRMWQEELERAISNTASAAVFVGPSNIGPWQNQEMRAILVEFVEQGCPVMPVLLPGSSPVKLPLFLKGRSWVDLRTEYAEGIDRIVWGVSGRKPGEPSGSREPSRRISWLQKMRMIFLLLHTRDT